LLIQALDLSITEAPDRNMKTTLAERARSPDAFSLKVLDFALSGAIVPSERQPPPETLLGTLAQSRTAGDAVPPLFATRNLNLATLPGLTLITLRASFSLTAAGAGDSSRVLVMVRPVGLRSS
jgi:hypothetical protein